MLHGIKARATKFAPVTISAIFGIHTGAAAAIIRDLAHWLYRQLRDAHEYETSDAVVDEAIGVS